MYRRRRPVGACILRLLRSFDDPAARGAPRGLPRGAGRDRRSRTRFGCARGGDPPRVRGRTRLARPDGPRGDRHLRTRYASAGELDDLLPIAQNLARAAAEAVAAADVVLAKGGITSHTTALVGLGARSARVSGPITDGVALWELEAARGPTPYVVFPGNVGTDSTLRDVVDLILGRV